MKRLTAGLSLAILFPLGGISQSAEPSVYGSAGTHLSSASAQMSFTIGEPVTATHTTGNAIMTQGFHQTNLEVISSVPQSMPPGLRVYPNPVSEELVIEHNFSDGAVAVRITDAAGRLVSEENISGAPSYRKSFGSHTPGHYVLSLTQKGKQYHFTIIKTH